ncbi:MAG: glycosyltransferase [Anaerolineales bacterium]|nr:glycosyltransferase [Anaerolineales bacterium]
MPTVSVIIPSYNHEKYIGECIQSVLNQTYQDFEIVITDDGSQDKTVANIRQFNDPRIKLLIHNKNKGTSVASNTCINSSSGKFVALLGSDDAWMPEKLEKQVEFLEQNLNVGVVFSREITINENSNRVYQTVYSKVFDLALQNRSKADWARFFFFFGNCLCAPSSLIRRDVFDEIGLFDERLAGLQDFDLWVKICLKHDVHLMEDRLTLYRVHDNYSNLSADTSENNIRNIFEYKQILNNYLQIKDVDFFKKVFPESGKYGEVKPLMIPYFLGRIALDTTRNFQRQWGVEAIYSFLENGELADMLEKDCGFSYVDYIKLAKETIVGDSYLSSQLAETQAQLTKAQALSAQLTKVSNSKIWKVISFFHRIQIKLLPSGSYREKLLHLVYRAFKVAYDEGPVALLNGIRRRFDRLVKTRFIYNRWIDKNEPHRKQLAEQREASRQFHYRPLVSIVIPVYKTPIKILMAGIQSVIGQTYDNWELCIANGSPDVADVRRVLDSYARKDPRIKVVHLAGNLGIAGNTNAALSLATGDFVGFLDHDDLLAPFALFEVVVALKQDPDSDLLYSDEDQISKDGKKRFGPHFKPAYNKDLLRSINYITHFMVVRKTLGDKIGWLKIGYDGAQDYDLTLRAVEQAKRIVHIPKVLYHWRHWPSSTTNTPNVSPIAIKNANESGKKALMEHLERCGLNGEVEDGPDFTTYQVKYRIKDPAPLVSIIILNRDHSEYLYKCIVSIRTKSNYENYEIIVVENASQEEQTFRLYSELKKDPVIRIIEYKEPFNFSRANNYAVGHARGDVILFLNNDTEIISPNWLERMLEHALRAEVGGVGAKLYYPDNTIQHAGVILGIAGFAGHSHKYSPGNAAGYINRLRLVQNYTAVTGACLMMRKVVFYEIGCFDEQYELALSDIDLCLKAQSNNYLIVWTPYAELYHHESKTRGSENTNEKTARFRKEIDYFKYKWASFFLKGDPCYSPNLSLEYEDFRLKE